MNKSSSILGQKNNHEPGYKPLLVREETKNALQEFRRTLPDRDLNQERRIATAAIEVVLERSDLHQELLRRIGDVAKRDIDQKMLA